MYHDLENEFLDLLEADQNDPQVAYALGLCYLRGEGTEQDGAKAEQWLRRAAEPRAIRKPRRCSHPAAAQHPSGKP